MRLYNAPFITVHRWKLPQYQQRNKKNPPETDLKTVGISISLEEMTSLLGSFVSVLFDEVSFRLQMYLFRTTL